MPVFIQGSPYSRSRFSFKDGVKNPKLIKENKLKYPRELDFTPGSEVHEHVLNEVMLRGHESSTHMSANHPDWKLLDENVRAFIPLDKEEERIKKNDPRIPVSIVVPEMYATLETLLTAMMGQFDKLPLFEYLGTGPEDSLGAILLEKIIEYQTERSKMILPLHTQWRDAFLYGVGYNTLIWEVITGKRSMFKDVGFFDPFIGDPETGFFKTGQERMSESSILYEGGKLESLDNYKVLPDPNAQDYDIQSMEYFGWLDTHNHRNSLLRREAEPGSPLFNIGYLEQAAQSRSSLYQMDDSGREETSTATIRSGSPLTNPYDVIWMYWDLIPSREKLGRVNVPEKWLFGVAADEVIIAAHPMDLDHNMIPVTCAAPDFGGHEEKPLSRMGTIQGLQTVLSYEINNHQEWLRRAGQLNVVVDPRSVNYRDVLEGNGIIKLNKSQWGRDVRSAIEQLKLTDPNPAYGASVALTTQMSRQAAGTPDALQGIQRQHGERVTKSEFDQTRGSAVSRAGKAGRIMALQALADLGFMLAKNTQQFLSEDTFIKVAGRHKEDLRMIYNIQENHIEVTPWDLDVAFDVSIRDGSLSGGEHIDAWVNLYTATLQNPEAAAKIDSVRLLMHIAHLTGAENITDFVKLPETNVDVLPDDEVSRQRQAGNIIPLEGARA